MIARFTTFRIGAVVAAALALQACGTGAGDVGNSFSAAYDKGFKEKFTETFAASCTKGAIGKGAPADMANKLCTCGAQELAKTKTTSELTALTPEQSAGALTACQQKLGLAR